MLYLAKFKFVGDRDYVEQFRYQSLHGRFADNQFVDSQFANIINQSFNFRKVKHTNTHSTKTVTIKEVTTRHEVMRGESISVF